MKKFLLTLVTLVATLAATPPIYAADNEVVAYTLEFNSQWTTADDAKKTGYSQTWTATNPNDENQTWKVTNFNHNGWNGWSYIKCGSKSAASTGYITSFQMPEAITSVVLTIDALTVSNVNSITLYTSDSESFETSQSYTVTKAKGDQKVVITQPAENLYYKLAFDCKKGSSNGLLTLSKVVYNKAAAPAEPQEFTYFNGKEFSVEKDAMDAFEVPYNAPADLIFISNDENVATIEEDGNGGYVLCGLTAGTTTITASWDASELWLAGESTFTVTVTEPLKEAVLTMTENLSVDIAKDNTCTLDFLYEGAAAPEYTITSSNEQVATIASNDAESVTLNIAGEGNTTITLTVTGEGYKEVSATCEVTVINSDISEVTIDFSKDIFANINTTNSNTYYNSETIEKNGVSIDFTGKFRQWKSQDFRIYSQAFTMTVTAPEGKVVESISSQDANLNWTGNESPAKVSFTPSSTITITSITVKLAEAPVYNVATPTFNLVEGDYGYTLEMACETEGAKIYYTEDGSEPTAESTLYVNPVEVWGTPTIKAVAINEAGDASAVASFSEAIPYLIDSFMPLSDFPDGTAVTVKGAMTVVYQNGAYLYVQDANGSGMLLYGTTDATYANGDTFSVLKGTYTVFNGLPEITGYVISDVTAGTPVEPRNASLAYATTMLNSYVKIENVSVVDNTITDIDGNKVVLYDRFKLATILSGENIDIIGFFGYYIAKDGKESAQFYPVEMTATPAPDQAPILIGGSEFQGDRLELDYAMEVTFPTIEGHSVWYKLTAITTEPAENDIEAYAEVDEEGYTRYEGAFNVDPTLHNSLSYYVQNDANGMRSEVRTLAVGISTGVSLIEAEEAEAEYFNLQGIRVDRPAEGGVYLRRIGSKVVKVIK